MKAALLLLMLSMLFGCSRARRTFTLEPCPVGPLEKAEYHLIIAGGSGHAVAIASRTCDVK